MNRAMILPALLLFILAAAVPAAVAQEGFNSYNFNVRMKPDLDGKVVMIGYKQKDDKVETLMFVELATGAVLDKGPADGFGMPMKQLRYRIADGAADEQKLKNDRTSVRTDDGDIAYYYCNYKDTQVAFVAVPFWDGIPGIEFHRPSRTVLFYIDHNNDRYLYNATWWNGKKDRKGPSKPLMKVSKAEKIRFENISFSPDGTLAWIDEGSIMLSTDKNRIRWRAEKPGFTPGLFSADGESLAAVQEQEGVNIYDARSGKLQRRIPAPPAALASGDYKLSYLQPTTSMNHYIARYSPKDEKKDAVRLYIISADGKANAILP